ncbi:putative ribonuclease H protein [Nymphaea thermarum]|nr:putative ribonuclease H protein [Nymphaea thermarum]
MAFDEEFPPLEGPVSSPYEKGEIPVRDSPSSSSHGVQTDQGRGIHSWASLLSGGTFVGSQPEHPLEVEIQDGRFKIFIPKEAYDEMNRLFQWAALARLQGSSTNGRTNFSFVFQELTRQWAGKAHLKFTILAGGTFLIRVEDEQQLHCITQKQAWRVGGRTLVTCRWQLGFANLDPVGPARKRKRISLGRVDALVDTSPPSQTSNGESSVSDQHENIDSFFIFDTLINVDRLHINSSLLGSYATMTNADMCDGVVRILCGWKPQRYSVAALNMHKYWILLDVTDKQSHVNFLVGGDHHSYNEVMHALNTLKLFSGLCVKPHKSHVISLGEQRAPLSFIINSDWRLGSLPLPYLGTPLFAGRPCLIRYVLFSLMGYWCFVFMLPKTIQHKLEATMANFLWGSLEARKGVHLVAWKTICHPVLEGGVGLKHLDDWNKACIGRITLRICQDDAPWANFIKKKYLSFHSLWTLKCPKKESWFFKGVRKSWNQIQEHVRWSIGNGSIRFWTNNWGGSPLISHLNPLERSAFEFSLKIFIKQVLDSDRLILDNFKEFLFRLGMERPNLEPHQDLTLWQNSPASNIKTFDMWEVVRRKYEEEPWRRLIWFPQAHPKAQWLTNPGPSRPGLVWPPWHWPAGPARYSPGAASHGPGLARPGPDRLDASQHRPEFACGCPAHPV